MKLLTQNQVDRLPDGTKIIVTWDGGNGPHEYIFKDGAAYTEDGHRVGVLDFVGKEKYNQHVEVADPK